MNEYREKLYKIAQLLRTVNGDIEASKLLDELLNDKNLLLVNKECLPIIFEKKEIVNDNLFCNLGVDYTVKYEAKLQLQTNYTYDGYPIDKADEEIAKQLRESFYYCLEKQDTPVLFDTFKVFRYVNGKLVE